MVVNSFLVDAPIVFERTDVLPALLAQKVIDSAGEGDRFGSVL